MRWLALRVEAGAECEDAVAQMLLEAGAHGVAVEDLGHRRAVSAYLPGDSPVDVDGIRERVEKLARYGLHPGPVQVTAGWIRDEDWAESWKRHYRPLVVGRRLLVKPAWLDVEPAGREVIELDPGMAFGTGHHPTTQLCLEALDELVRRGDPVADVGTGSGILAIAAARLGAEPVVAVDVDPVAVQVAIDNCRRNGVERRVRVARGSAATAKNLLPGGQARTVVVNILAKVIEEMAGELVALLAPGGRLVAGGIVAPAAAGVGAGLERAGRRVDEERARDEWRCLIGTRAG
ncbi:MAG: 50S ribosomal protein L11 methyltransferase [Firmicutes bacterium]|nr:50S ribosomal protein L11 methyltransferase [Bacillota bacterium]